MYRDQLNGLYVVVRSLFLLLLTCSAWPCLGCLGFEHDVERSNDRGFAA